MLNFKKNEKKFQNVTLFLLIEPLYFMNESKHENICT